MSDLRGFTLLSKERERPHRHRDAERLVRQQRRRGRGAWRRDAEIHGRRPARHLPGRSRCGRRRAAGLRRDGRRRKAIEAVNVERRRRRRGADRVRGRACMSGRSPTAMSAAEAPRFHRARPGGELCEPPAEPRQAARPAGADLERLREPASGAARRRRRARDARHRPLREGVRAARRGVNAAAERETRCGRRANWHCGSLKTPHCRWRSCTTATAACWLPTACRSGVRCSASRRCIRSKLGGQLVWLAEAEQTEIVYSHGVENTSVYLDSPLRVVDETGKPFRSRLTGPPREHAAPARAATIRRDRLPDGAVPVSRPHPLRLDVVRDARRSTASATPSSSGSRSPQS